MSPSRSQLSLVFLGFLVCWPAFAQPVANPPAAHVTDLRDADAEKAYLAMRRLAASPKETLALFRETQKPELAVDRKIIDELIAQLSSNRFAVREKAIRELERLDRHALGALQKAAQSPPDLETKRRAEELIARQESRLSGDGGWHVFAAPSRRDCTANSHRENMEWTGTLSLWVSMLSGWDSPGRRSRK